MRRTIMDQDVKSLLCSPSSSSSSAAELPPVELLEGKKRTLAEVEDDDDDDDDTSAEAQDRAFVEAARWGDIQVLVRLMGNDDDRPNKRPCRRRRRVNATSSDWFGKTALHRASYYGQMDALQFLLEKGAHVNTTDQLGSTPLHEAIDGRQSVLLVKLLLTHGAHVDAKNKYGQTPLHTATRLMRLDLIECLLRDGNPNVNAVDNEGVSPLRLAIEQHEGSQHPESTLTKVLQALLEAGANPNQIVYCGSRKQTALHWLIRFQQYTDLVSRILASSLDDMNVELELDAFDSDGMTVLHLAIQGGHMGWVRHMLHVHETQPEKHPRLLLAREFTRDESALDMAAEGGHVEIVARILQISGEDPPP